MQAIIFSRKTGLYLQSLGKWTSSPADAYIFQTPESAEVFRQYHSIPDALILKNPGNGHAMAPLPPVKNAARSKNPKAGRRANGNP